MLQTFQARLDESRPYATLLGPCGRAHTQDGLYFNMAGDQIPEPNLDFPEEEPEPEIDPNIIPTVIEAQTPPAEEAKPESYDGMHWRKLQVLVEMWGGKYTDKKSAIEFLQGKKA